jgi:hypothetical protein
MRWHRRTFTELGTKPPPDFRAYGLRLLVVNFNGTVQIVRHWHRSHIWFDFIRIAWDQFRKGKSVSKSTIDGDLLMNSDILNQTAPRGAQKLDG